MPRWLRVFTSFEGRISRKQFWRALLVLTIGQAVSFVLILIVYSAILEQFYPNWSSAQTTMELVASELPAIVIWFVIGLWPTLAIFTKRWHDQEKSGWWNLTAPPFVFFAAAVVASVGVAMGYEGQLRMLVQIALWSDVIWVLIALGCLRGTNGPNLYGPDPRAVT
jgi:uncharacterized membrane protein YhaH (DUF805 family)